MVIVMNTEQKSMVKKEKACKVLVRVPERLIGRISGRRRTKGIFLVTRSKISGPIYTHLN